MVLFEVTVHSIHCIISAHAHVECMSEAFADAMLTESCCTQELVMLHRENMKERLRLLFSGGQIFITCTLETNICQL